MASWRRLSSHAKGAVLHLNAATDGTVEMLASEAESFLSAGWERVD